MKRLALGLCLTSAAVVLLNGCGGSQPENLPPATLDGGSTATRGIPDRATFKVLHNFQAGSYKDGAVPLAKLANVDGVLYGTTKD